LIVDGNGLPATVGLPLFAVLLSSMLALGPPVQVTVLAVVEQDTPAWARGMLDARSPANPPIANNRVAIRLIIAAVPSLTARRCTFAHRRWTLSKCSGLM
jgi:hypothetical protein